jgi:hypothetical protein
MRVLPLHALIIAASCAQAPAMALAEPWHCRFTVECAASLGCEAVGFDARLIAADHAGELFLSTTMGDSPIIRLTPQGVLPASYAGTSRSATAELVTIAADRTAIMSLHIFDGEATAITYFGTCEELT